MLESKSPPTEPNPLPAGDPFYNPRHRLPKTPVKVIIIGAGDRGSDYAQFAQLFPREMQIVGVAEPNTTRREHLARIHQIDPDYSFETWEQVFARGCFADAVIIATPDALHFAPCMRAMEMGYDVLLEKPIAQTEEECLQISAFARKTGRIVGVCHVLRYTPYFRQIKTLIAQGAIGQLISLQHLEPIEYVHMSHSYVRGNWRDSTKTTPIVLAKSSHDFDILSWLVGEPAENVHCFGNLKWFRKENAPEGSRPRCTDGCTAEPECPYSALKIYHRDHKRLHVFDLPDDSAQWSPLILQKLKTTNYGRCVYDMDNNQPDHLTVNLLYRNGVTAAFSMEAFVSYEGRRTRIMGSHGDIEGDMEHFTINSSCNGKRGTWSMKTDAHGGGDLPMVRDWLQAVAWRDPKLFSSTIDESVESHLTAFAAERSRINRTVEVVPR